MSELVYSNVSKTGVWGRNPAAAGGHGGLFVSFVSFCWAIFVSFWKKTILISLDHISHEFRGISKN